MDRYTHIYRLEKQKKQRLRKYLPDHLVDYAYKNYSQYLINGLKKNFLLSKILKEKYFWKSKFKTTNKTLDPRPETEIIIEECLKKYKNDPRKLKTLDLCSGTGCIGISLQNEINTHVTFTDISKDALKVCKYNVRIHKNFSKSQFFLSDMFLNLPNKKYNICVSNPPYLTKEEVENNDFLRQDPYISLYGGHDGLEFYRIISENLKEYITEYAFIEICSQKLEKTLNIFKNKFQNIEVIRDLNNLPRVIIIKI
ncbi:hypothetical protein AB836_01675 [Rickettsiales bacterium (ex Bugula neritina AB1)]|nr:hypothetical protein AB836_01675 [Rickettsiales bacterium (ex Bugula neritina AB1)]